MAPRETIETMTLVDYDPTIKLAVEKPTPKNRRKRFQRSVSFRTNHTELMFAKNPSKTWNYFCFAIFDCAASIKLPSRTTLGSAFALCSMIYTFVMSAKSGSFGDSVREAADVLVNETLEALWWTTCGILATAGLGCGVQTGALFLFPHIVKISLAWDGGFYALIFATFLPGFWAGTGSAIGELVPFLLARAIRRAGGDPFSLLADEDDSHGEEGSDEVSTEKKRPVSQWTPKVLLANSRKAMERQLATGSFWKIALLAAIPNALFDLCGLVCGSMDVVTLPTFFLALWAGKALIRTPMQTCGLATAVFVATSDTPSENKITAAFQTWGRKVIDQLSEHEDQTADQAESTDGNFSVILSSFKILWLLVAAGLFGVFVISTMEQIAQHHVKSRYHQEIKKAKE